MTKFTTEIKRINGYLKEVVTFLDDSGQPISHIINPIMVELKPRDLLQIFIGSLLIASPLSFTEEIWNLSINLKLSNIIYLMISSLTIVVTYVYFNFYRFKLKGHIIEFIKRIIAIYVISTFSVMFTLFLIDKLPIFKEPLVAFKRVVIIGFPAIFGATLTDSLK